MVKKSSENIIVENIILFILSIFGIVLGILISLKLVTLNANNFNESNQIILGLLLIVISSLCLVLSTKNIIKRYKLKNKKLLKIHQELYDQCNNQEIKNKFLFYDYHIDDFSIDDEKSISIFISYNELYDLILDINDNSYSIQVDFTGEYFQKIADDNEDDNFFKEFDELGLVTYPLTNDTNFEDIINNINSFIDNNLVKIENLRKIQYK